MICMVLKAFFSNVSSRSKTFHMWIDCVIKAVFSMMMYICAKRERLTGDYT